MPGLTNFAVMSADKIGKQVEIFCCQTQDLLFQIVWNRRGRPPGSGSQSRRFEKQTPRSKQRRMVRLVPLEYREKRQSACQFVPKTAAATAVGFRIRIKLGWFQPRIFRCFGQIAARRTIACDNRVLEDLVCFSGVVPASGQIQKSGSVWKQNRCNLGRPAADECAVNSDGLPALAETERFVILA